MRFDMLKSKAQKGAFLVLIAILVPVFMMIASLVLDLGRAWVSASQLQNATDAAALAGAYVYYKDDSDDKRLVKNRINNYLNSNYNSNARFYKLEDKKDVFIRNAKDSGDNSILLSVRAYLDVSVGWAPIKDLNITWPVMSTVKLSPIHVTPSSDDSVFGYGIIGAYIRPKYGWIDSVFIETPGNKLIGKMYAGNTVRMYNQGYLTIDKPENFSTTAKDDHELWTSWYGDTSCSVTSDGRPISVNTEGTQVPPIDISLKDNDKTKDIYQLVDEMASKYGKDGQIHCEDGNYFIKTTGDYSNTVTANPSWQYDFISDVTAPGWKPEEHPGHPNAGGARYKYIITDGNIRINPSNYVDDGKSYMVIISLHGNVHITSLKLSPNQTFRAMIYAPNGNVLYNNGNSNFEGSIVANTIDVTGGNNTFIWKNFLSDGSSSSSDSGSGNEGKPSLGQGGVQLHPNHDDHYGDAMAL